ncbi:MAG TPA: hypothetical protein VFZ78_13535 [Flavisolibacter sp.]
MKHLLFIIIVTGAMSCNNDAKNDSIGDSLDRDPQTAQPITTNPDTVGPGPDTTKNQNH